MAKIVAFTLVMAGTLWGSSPAQEQPQGWETAQAKLDAARLEMVHAPAEALILAEEAESLSILADAALPGSGASTNTQLGTALWLQVEALTRLNQPDDALPILDRAFQVLGDEEGQLTGLLLLSKGRLARAMGDSGTALEAFQSAYRVFTDIGDPKYRAASLESLGTLYANAQQYEKALDYFERAAAIHDKNELFTILSMRNRAKILLKLGEIDAARSLLEEALESNIAQNSDLLTLRIATILAQAELADDDLAAAEQSIALGLSRSDVDGAEVWLPILLSENAELAYRQGDIQGAVELFDTAFDGVDLKTTSSDLKEAHKTAYDIYNAAGRTDSTLAHLEAFQRLDEADRDVAASANLAILNAEFELSNKELEIATLRSERLEADVALIRARRQQERIGYGAAVAAALTAVGFLAWWTHQSGRMRKMTEAMNHKLESVNHKLRRSNVELEKANLAKTEFLATTSHEVRTPLNAVINLTEIVLHDTPENTDAHEKLSTALRSAQHLHAIVSDVLDVARFEGNRVSAHYAAMNIEATLLDVAQLWRPKAEEKGLGFSADISVGNTPFVTDEKLLRQVLSNLLSNAIKFTDKGFVRLVATGGEGQPVKISVQDSGIGIPEDKHDLIFESFRQVDTGGTRSFAGTGLGLAICRRISELLGGTIELDSALGKGTTFHVMIPAAKAGVSAPLKPVQPSAPPTDVDGALSSLRILAAEDNAVNAMVIQAILKAKIDSLTIVENGREAVDAVSNGDFDVVLMDKQMPVMDGVEATKRIRALDRPAADIPIIAVTADAFAAAQDELMAAGADRYLAKPIKPDDLKKTIVDVVSGPDDKPNDELVNS
ncbi:MAG: ATP-binding protein [Pseudomonadota bacterium]